MTRQRLRLMIDAGVLASYAKGCLDQTGWKSAGGDCFPDNSRDACRLLVLLGSVHEFELVTLGSEMVRLTSLLMEAGVDRERSEGVARKLLEVVSIVPQEASHMEQAFGIGADVGDLATRLLLACAKSAGCHGVVTTFQVEDDPGEDDPGEGASGEYGSGKDASGVAASGEGDSGNGSAWKQGEVMASCGFSRKQHDVMSPCSFSREQHDVMSPCGFFRVLRERYGIDYAEVTY